VEDDGLVRVDVSMPRFKSAHIPFLADTPAGSYTLEIDGHPEAVSPGIRRRDEASREPIHGTRP